jgi:hypothetical protein
MLVGVRTVLQAEGASAGLDACLDGDGGTLAEWERPEPGSAPAPPVDADLVAGLTTWAPAGPPQAQLRVAGVLHALAGSGTAAVILPQTPAPTAETVVEILRHAWRHTSVAGIRLVRADITRQPTFLGPV